MKRFIISILALTIILLLTGTCKREYVEFQKSDIPETTKVISDDVWVELIRAIDTTDYTFSFEQNPGVTEGDILVSSFDGGYLRRVTAIKQEGDAIIVETEFASLTDVVSEGQTSFNSVLSLQKVGRINYLKEGMVLDTTLMKSTENTPLEYDIDVYLDPQQKIHIQGHFSLLTDLNGEIEIKFIPPRISYFELTYNIDQNLDLAADIELMDNNYNKEIGLANITFQPIIAMLSGVPVVLVPELEIIAGIESSVDCHVYSSLTQHMDYTMGIVYEDRQWNTINELNKSFDFSPPQLSCNAAAKAYIKPQFNIKIYDVVSPYLYADLYGNIEADLQSSPWWNLYAGADIGIGIKAVILGHEIFDFNTNPPLIQFEQLIASATSHNTPPTALFTVSPSSGTTSTNFAFDASGSTDNETPTSQLQVRWDFDGNGSWDTNWDTDKTQNHQYSTEATYNAKLEVKDNEGLTDQYTRSITVSNGGGGFNDVFNPATGQTWMDRNLGASRVAQSSTDEQAYGDLYQWGRLTDGHEKRNSGTTSTLSNSDTPGHGNFITVTSTPYDWRSPQNNNLWQGVSGTNNPCPAGYRLPTEAEWEAERQSWSSSNAAGAFNSPLKLPVAGHRYGSNGSLTNVGSYGYYWSATVDAPGARNLLFGSSRAGMYHDDRAVGHSVRCLKD
jgi:uncharacterized protein (TIGR02145 family)